MLDRALRLRRPGPYQLQAAIAALHADAPTPAATDWRADRRALRRARAARAVAGGRLNRAVAVAMADGPRRGLALLDALLADRRSTRYHRCTRRAPSCCAAPGDARARAARLRARDRAQRQRRRARRAAPARGPRSV